VPLFVGGAGSPSNTISPGPRPTSVPSGILDLIHPTVWPQYTNVTDRQYTGPVAYGEPLLVTVARKFYCQRHYYRRSVSYSYSIYRAIEMSSNIYRHTAIRRHLNNQNQIAVCVKYSLRKGVFFSHSATDDRQTDSNCSLSSHQRGSPNNRGLLSGAAGRSQRPGSCMTASCADKRNCTGDKTAAIINRQ